MMNVSPSKILLLLAPLLLANCKSTRTGGSGASTPSHNMSRSEYPFDENGVYHEEWAKGNDTSNVVDLTTNNPPSTFLNTTDPRDAYNPPASKPKVTSSGGGSSKPKVTAKPTSKPKVVAKPKPKPKPAPKFTTVTVKQGDSLYALSKRYGVSVGAIQSANGMGSSTLLKDGRSLKIPK
jgi:LysM repeat protein